MHVGNLNCFLKKKRKTEEGERKKIIYVNANLVGRWWKVNIWMGTEDIQCVSSIYLQHLTNPITTTKSIHWKNYIVILNPIFILLSLSFRKSMVLLVYTLYVQTAIVPKKNIFYVNVPSNTSLRCSWFHCHSNNCESKMGSFCVAYRWKRSDQFQIWQGRLSSPLYFHK